MIVRHTYHIRGMDCAEEIEALKATVGKLAGVSHLDFNLLNGSMSLDLPEGMPDDSIFSAVRHAGLRAVRAIPGKDGEMAGESFWERRGRLLTCMASAVTLATGLMAGDWRGMAPSPFAASTASNDVTTSAGMGLLLASAILGMWHIIPKAAVSAAHRRADMNLLMTIAILGAIAIGDWAEAATASFLFALALWLESWSVARSRRAIHALTRLSPVTACYACPNQGTTEERPVDEIAVGSTIIVAPGKRFPLDARVIRGNGSVDESPLSGESAPVTKSIGDTVFAGTINNESLLTLQVTRPFYDTVMARIIRMVEEAENRRAPMEQWIDRFSRSYTPAMIVMAILVAIGPPLFLHAGWGTWFERALVLLVIACPCALVISTPVGIIAGITAAARHGVLIKGGVHLETASRLQAIAIDKTGTLTHGHPTVQKVFAFNGFTPNQVLALAAAIESMGSHPLARAITREAAALGVQVPPVESYRAIPGKGSEGVLNASTLWIGSHRLMHEKAAETHEVHELAMQLEDAGHTVVALGSADTVIGLISIADAVRPTAAPMVASLRRIGIRRVVMLTGDNAGTASAVALATGIDHVYAELLPEDKMKQVHQLVTDYGIAGMVGDGVNDAPAMAASSLGIAMGAAGSDAAIESADVALMTDDLSKIPWLIRHAQRVMSTIRANAIFAIGIKSAIMLLAMGGMATLWMAIAADTGATLLVVLWSLRLLKG